MNVKLIGKHEKDSRACRDGLALTLDEMMAQDKSICYVDCDLMISFRVRARPSRQARESFSCFPISFTFIALALL